MTKLKKIEKLIREFENETKIRISNITVMSDVVSFDFINFTIEAKE